MSEWVQWHRGYDGDQPLARRLQVVRECIRRALDACPPGPIRLVSMCAGDGRDLLGELPGHPRVADVSARLVELDPELVRRGQERAAAAGLQSVGFVRGDAGISDAYAGAVPADLLLVCGVFGNVTDEDIEGTITHLPGLCAPSATVIWTRGRFAPDLTPSIRAWFAAAGFAEEVFIAVPDSLASVGVHGLHRPPQAFRPGVRLFTFLEPDQRPSHRR
jgi:hypothetical protein